MTPSSKTQSMGVYALGIPDIAIITRSTQNEDASGGDTNVQTQTNPVTTTTGSEALGTAAKMAAFPVRTG